MVAAVLTTLTIAHVAGATWTIAAIIAAMIGIAGGP